MLAKLKQIEKTKIQISVLRDKLREQTVDLEGIADECDQAVNDIEDGLRFFSDAADAMSKYL